MAFWIESIGSSPQPSTLRGTIAASGAGAIAGERSPATPRSFAYG
jgi:hypothetical protein